MNKKAFVSLHPGMFFIVGIIIGMLLMYYLAAKGIVPLGLFGGE